MNKSIYLMTFKQKHRVEETTAHTVEVRFNRSCIDTDTVEFLH